MVMLSVRYSPDTSPDPYCIENVILRPTSVDDRLGRYRPELSQSEGFHEFAQTGSTHNSEDPVSIMTVTCCGGVPIDTRPFR